MSLASVYRASTLPPRDSRRVLAAAFRSAETPADELDVSFAALVLAVAQRHRPRAEGLLEFHELCYAATDLDEGARRAGRMVAEVAAIAGGTLPADMRFDRGWTTLAACIRELFAATSAPPPIRSFLTEHRPLVPRRVVLRPSGGLGNQMFQYAAALAYARRTKLPLRLDLDDYERSPVERDFLLGRLRVPVLRAYALEIIVARRRTHAESIGFHDEFMLGSHGPAWLTGYWENPAYFADVVTTLRRRFQPRDPAVSAAARQLVESARSGGGPVVGVHLRRGDRAPGEKAFSPLSTLPSDYYREAARMFPSDASFLVFSDTPDDIAWCRAHLGLSEGARVSFGDGLDPIVDLFALANCDHVILSSGTFSWWAGYLGERPGRRVIVCNPLQAMSASRVVSPPLPPVIPGWEALTLPRQEPCFSAADANN